MPFMIDEILKTSQSSPFRGQLVEREIVVIEGAVWPTGVGDDYVIPLGIPMCVVTASTNGRYKPVRRTTLPVVGAATIALTVNCADGFAAGDVIDILLAADYVQQTVGTIASVDYGNNIIYLTNANSVTGATGDFVTVTENAAPTDPVDDAVFLAESVQTRVEGVSIVAPSRGYIEGQVEISALENISPNCYDAIIANTQISGFDYIPTQPGA